MTSHAFCAFFIGLAYYLQNPQLFVIGALSEFAFETIDMVRVINLIRKGGHMFECVLLTIHHQAAFTAILPACLYYADNRDVQQITWGLLGLAPMVLALLGFFSTRDVYNLQERGQYTVSYLIMTVLYFYFRWYITVSGMYAFLTGGEFTTLSFGFKAMLILFCVGIKLFDVTHSLVMLNNLYQWLFTPKCMERPTKITKASLMKPCSVPVQLIRMRSTPLF